MAKRFLYNALYLIAPNYMEVEKCAAKGILSELQGIYLNNL